MTYMLQTYQISFFDTFYLEYFSNFSELLTEQKNNEDVLPLYRGHGTGMKFSGLSLIN